MFFVGLGPWLLGGFTDKGGLKMKTTIHRSNSRGFADHGWLKSSHSFSFASYYNPDRMGFGLLRVLNDDQVAASRGFATHPHQNMEIVSIPLAGSLRHKDSEGNETVIKDGEVQIMSAGTGVRHSEYNHSGSHEVNFLQIWVMPEKVDIKPRYEQKVFSEADRKNQWQIVVSPIGTSDGGVKINQQAYFSLLDLDRGKEISYALHQPQHGLYVFLLDGETQIGSETLNRRDALGLEDLSSVNLVAKKDSKILLIEVPMAG